MRQSAIGVLILGVIFLLACAKKQSNSGEPTHGKKAAVVFTFDDTAIDTWYDNRDLFDQYGIKATFFLTRPYLLDSPLVAQLHALEEAGHEVGCHTWDHLNALEYLQTHTLAEYMDAEVLRAKDTMLQLGFNPVTFAYAFGLNNAATDAEILKHFTLLRTATQNFSNTTLDQIDEIYYPFDDSKVINSMGLDVFYHNDLSKLIPGLQRAKTNEEAIVFYAHRIDDSGQDFTVSRSFLDSIFRAVDSISLESLRFKDLSQ